MYTHPLGQIIRTHNLSFHMYADDTQIYGSALPNDFSILIDCVTKCVHDVNVWMVANKLKLNSDKTEVMACSTGKKLSSLQQDSISVGNEVVPLSSKVKNLGVYLDSELRFR